MQTSDEELVERTLAGDQEAYGVIVERYQGRVVNFLYRIISNYDRCHDLAQDVFFRVYRALDRFDPQYRFSTWFFRVAQNLAIDDLRKKRFKTVSLHKESREDGESWEQEVASEDPHPYGNLRNMERGQAIEKAIEALPWEYRELILLRHFADMAYQDIADLKEMPLGTVKNKLFRGRQLLKKTLMDFLED